MSFIHLHNVCGSLIAPLQSVFFCTLWWNHTHNAQSAGYSNLGGRGVSIKNICGRGGGTLNSDTASHSRR